MLIKNKKYNTHPVILHNPHYKFGTKSSEVWEKLRKHRLKKCNKPEDLTILTWNNLESLGILQNQLNDLNIDYICLGQDIKKWTTNRLKIKLFLNYAAKIKTKYVLCMDCYDTIIISDISDIIDKYKYKNCKLLFNATNTVHPMKIEDKKIEENLCPSPFSFLNSGVFLGETEYIEDVFSDLDLNDQKYFHSDQIIIRKLYHKLHPLIQIDYDCSIFQIHPLNHKNEHFELITSQKKLLL